MDLNKILLNFRRKTKNKNVIMKFCIHSKNFLIFFYNFYIGKLNVLSLSSSLLLEIILEMAQAITGDWLGFGGFSHI